MFALSDTVPDGITTLGWRVRLFNFLFGSIFLVSAVYFTVHFNLYGRAFSEATLSDFTVVGEVKGNWVVFLVIALQVACGFLLLLRAIAPPSQEKAVSLWQRLEAGEEVSLFALTHKERDALKGRAVCITSCNSATPLSITGLAGGMYSQQSPAFVVNSPQGDVGAFLVGGPNVRYIYEMVYPINVRLI